MNKCICVDWLQCHVKLPRQDFENIFEPVSQAVSDGAGGWIIKKVQTTELKELDNRYLLERTGFQTRNFKAIFEIKDRETGEDIAVLAAEPRSEMCMQKDSGLIKIINKYLYQKHLLGFVQKLLSDLRLQFVNITRLDIALDFLTFDTMPCQFFIDQFASQQFMKKQQSKFKMMGDSWSVDKGKITGGISSLKFGLETSDVNYYLYNKTLELNQVKHKPWIHDHWKSNGWDGSQSVWRLEFSLHPDTKGIAHVNEKGEIETIYHFKDLTMLEHIDDIFQHYFKKHFQFVHVEKTKKGNYKKQSRCSEVDLFYDFNFHSVTIELSNKKDSGRSSKIFAKKLMELNRELRGQDFDLAIMGNELMTWVIKVHDLEAWQKKKMPDVELSSRVVDLVNAGRGAKLAMEITGMKSKPTKFKSAEEQEKALQMQILDKKRAEFGNRNDIF